MNMMNVSNKRKWNEANFRIPHTFNYFHNDNTRKLFKGTTGRQKTYEISHVYSVFYSSFMCQTTVIFGITKDGSLY